MKIDKVAGGHVPQTDFSQASKKPLEAPAPRSPEAAQFNANTAALDKAQSELAALPDVDMAKVEQVRNALVRGELSLDTHALSQAVMRFHTGHE
ncbi:MULTISPECIES: flagellar biosynthesis anti-sigma factor FlgM [Vibrio]|uniref:Negative regulator of flagellin synthesis n=1 Tax=Vibrio proteolyticus NBRC 13287 TaxID=1219065 RepID=U2ZXV0_VIBPR|nr:MULTISPECIES: flagellar biosynthesis anti-sigma factor FlgM [Vibrio]NAW57036.1 flagellar biosynthesis anti-sigma factor FlgM [Vibrio sp. V36_P2S2PM302]NAX22219.1 flagellar biosynthesis anti-sigma factor FlgM [Vibrio sp. V39_P1S14PM300]NAX26435.1 flagellar biosynthesis anti-sigma factor FlgM [Vibrio sp. V38_P2S17PM301]NAX32602.1 flagellar biosynthesis anti-sigma factor FlgM [Vibrio sp. V37_P2S8PM304]GAD66255.1 flagellin synthesis negative regulator [Vibrio proteolyticus NBRC 13287]